MSEIEFRRHSLRESQVDHLNQAGVDLARRIGETMGTFQRVFSSPASRCIETAIALGYAVDEHYGLVLSEDDWWDMADVLPAGCSFVDIAHAMAQHPTAKRLAVALRNQWTKVAEGLAVDGAALVVTHGGYIDYAAVACLPNVDYASWGEIFGRCEGFRLAFAEGRSGGLELLRVPDAWIPPGQILRPHRA